MLLKSYCRCHLRGEQEHKSPLCRVHTGTVAGRVIGFKCLSKMKLKLIAMEKDVKQKSKKVGR